MKKEAIICQELDSETNMAAIRKAVRSWDPRKIYDISPDERKALEERAKIRAELKAEWTKKSTDPFRGVNGYIVS